MMDMEYEYKVQQQAYYRLKEEFKEYKQESIQLEDYLEEDNNRLQKEIKQYQNKEQKMELIIQKLKSEVRIINQEQERKEQRIKELNELIKRQKSRIVEIEQKNEEHESRLRILDYEKSEIEDQCNGTQEQLIIVQEQLSEQIQNEQMEIQNYQQSLKDLQDENQSLRSSQKHTNINNTNNIMINTQLINNNFTKSNRKSTLVNVKGDKQLRSNGKCQSFSQQTVILQNFGEGDSLDSLELDQQGQSDCYMKQVNQLYQIYNQISNASGQQFQDKDTHLNNIKSIIQFIYQQKEEKILYRDQQKQMCDMNRDMTYKLQVFEQIQINNRREMNSRRDYAQQEFIQIQYENRKMQSEIFRLKKKLNYQNQKGSKKVINQHIFKKDVIQINSDNRNQVKKQQTSKLQKEYNNLQQQYKEQKEQNNKDQMGFMKKLNSIVKGKTSVFGFKLNKQ